MNLREQREKFEENYLSKYAAKSVESKGRKKIEEKCEIRTDFQRDRDRIIYSKSFRRLKHKTQVFISPEGDHYRTRLTHTLEVAQISRTISRALFLNEDLAEVIALGHDLGHTPFGHSGENILNEINPKGFRHYEQSLRVIDILEKEGGLNLTMEVRDGILNHTGANMAFTLEGQIVKFADRIAYINHDIEDAIRAGLLEQKELPKRSLKVLGEDSSTRINTMIFDLIENSKESNNISMSKEILSAKNELRDYLFDKIYVDSRAKEEETKAKNILKQLYELFKESPNKMPKEYFQKLNEYDIDTIVTDYIAGMTDRYAIKKFQDYFVPDVWRLI